MGGSYRLKKTRNAKFRSAYAKRNPRGLLSSSRRRTSRPLPKQRNPFAAYPRVNWADAVDNKRADPFSATDRAWKKVKKDYPVAHHRNVSSLERRGESFFRKRPKLTKGLTKSFAYGVELPVGAIASALNSAYQRYKKQKR